ncbi:ATP-dependent helicase [Actinomadura logoneensis]|uniref:DNA 3'-5' helicase n=1 Tax=Actinomadura logoneensis TaxID=2293572 RepID=A0A372JN51_9ACTN|nr:UvrD-helicase domain-containing protein [Actinomadura logoneensis]RFU41379.1 ATP-dependent helicase [Actinomadura logoneensis]
MAQLAISKDFLAEFTTLEKPVQKAVREAISRFAKHTHAGLHLEKLRNSRDPRIRTIRIDRFWRGVVLAPESGDLFCLLRVLPHDQAIKYAMSRVFTVNTVLGVLESRDEEQLRAVGTALEITAEDTSDRLFSHVKDADLLAFGIDDKLLPLIRHLAREEHLDALAHLLPPLQYDVLVAFAAHMEPEKIWDELSKNLVDAEAPASVDVEDLATAIQRTPDQVALIEGPEELQKMLQPPFALWRIFLHPMQRRIAYQPSYPGSIMVTGGAGTGKTVTALHRAAHLARRYRHDDGTPILVTTHTKSLAAELRRQLDLLIEDPKERARVEVVHIHQVAMGILRTFADGWQPTPISRRDLLQEMSTPDAGPADEFVLDEWEQVILAQDIRTLDVYRKVKRRGRKAALSPELRTVLWGAIEALKERLRAMPPNGCWTFTEIPAEAAGALVRSGSHPYRHIVVDEAQDLHPAQWRMLRAAVAEGPDDLFLVGDPHQRIWQHRVAMRDTGVNITGGRTKRLTISYRSTQEILDWARRVLGLVTEAELEGWPNTLDDFESPMHGRRPIVRRFADGDEEFDAVVEQVRGWLAAGVEPGAIGVVARVRYRAGDLQKRLRQSGIATEAFGATGHAVQVGTMHDIKGLEFQCVAVVEVQEGMMPHPRAVVPEETDPAAHSESLQRERCVLYVACTRARDRLHVSYHGAPSRFLPR